MASTYPSHPVTLSIWNPKPDRLEKNPQSEHPAIHHVCGQLHHSTVSFPRPESSQAGVGGGVIPGPRDRFALIVRKRPLYNTEAFHTEPHVTGHRHSCASSIYILSNTIAVCCVLLFTCLKSVLPFLTEAP